MINSLRFLKYVWLIKHINNVFNSTEVAKENNTQEMRVHLKHICYIIPDMSHIYLAKEKGLNHEKL